MTTTAAMERIGKAAAERHRRRSEALRIYRPLKTQIPFHTSMASERIVRGGNRSGKSMSAFAETASAATGMPIYTDNGPLPFKYPTDRGLLIWVVGYDQRHIGGTIHRMLFRPGAFRIIKDEVTKEWRPFCPWDEYDAAHEEKSKEAPPLIPPRMIEPKGWAWENKGERVFTVCRLVNGTEIHAFSSHGEPKQGDPVDLIHIDEDIEYPRHIPEYQARLSDRKGRMIWSVWPHSKNDALIEMSERAADQKKRKDPDVFEVTLRYSDNPFIDKDEKRKRIEAWSKRSPEEVRSRDLGEFITDTVLVYPSFSEELHGTPKETVELEDKVDEAIRKNNGVPPDDWCRYLALDPGHVVCAVLFVAVPPPSLGDHVVLYDELYLRRCDAAETARKVAERVGGKTFQTFIIDNRAGRQTPMGFNRTVKQQYADAFGRYNVRSEMTGSNFVPGSDNIQAGIGLVREWMAVRSDGTIKMKVVVNRMPNLKREFFRYHKRVVGSEAKEEPVDRNNHLMDCLRYLAAHNIEYARPVPGKAHPSPAWKAFQKWQEEESGEEDSEFVHMGPGRG